jgi:diaminopimelate decarboxylase
MSKVAPWTDAEIVDLAGRLPTPFHVYHEQTLRDQVRALKDAFSWCPGWKNYFAVKATPNPYILQVLKEEGCGGDCSSVTELELCKRVGMTADEVMFTSNNTPIAEYKVAKDMGAVVNLDDLSHVEFLHSQLGLPEFVSFRYNPGPERTGNVLIGDPKEAKFGNTMTQLLAGYKRCQELGVKRFGLHTMVVSNCLKADELAETARMLFTIVAQIKEKLGICIEAVNLGGGFGIPYSPEEKPLDVPAVGASIHALYKELVEAKGLAPLKVVLECGRFITGPAGFLVSRVCHTKSTYKNYVGCDACMANLMRPGMYGAYHHITVAKDERPPAGLPAREDGKPSEDIPVAKRNVFDVVGGLCENNDKFAIDRHLDVVPRVGDVLVIHDAGAHGHSMGFNYNGKPRSAEYLSRPDGTVVEIRRKETIEDLFCTLDFAGADDFAKGLKRKREEAQA